MDHRTGLGESPTKDVAWLLCLALAAVAALSAIWSVDYIPTNDGPQHVLQGHIENHYDDPGTIYARHLLPAPQYASKGFALLFVPLERMMHWKAALRVALSIIVLAAAFAFSSLVVNLHPARRPLAILGFALAFSWSFYMGFWPFALGTAIGIGAIAFVTAHDMEARRDWLILAAMLTAQAVCHMVTGLLTTAVVAVLLALRKPLRAAPARMGRLLLAGAPLFAVVALALTESGGDLLPTPMRWEPFGRWLIEAPRLILPGPTWRALVVCALLALALTTCAIRLKRHQSVHRDERALLVAALVFCTLGAIAPFDLPRWQYFSPRLLAFGATIGLSLIPLERLAIGHRRVALGALTVAALLSALVTARLHRNLAEGCGDALAGVDLPIRRSYVQLPVTFDPFCGVSRDPAESQIPHMGALRQIGALYAASHGGTVTNMFSGSPSIHAFVPREFDDDLPIIAHLGAKRTVLEDPELRPVVISYFAGYGAFYENVLLFGATAVDIDEFVARGFVPELRRDTFLMARFAGCPVELVIPHAPTSGRLQLEHGVWPVTTAMRSKQIERSALGSDGAIRLPLDRTPCGPLWAYVAWRGDGKLRRCAGAPPEGVITFEARGERTVVECNLDGE